MMRYALVVLIAGLVVVGCEKGEDSAAVTPGADAAGKADAEITQTVCPVMGGAINKDIYLDYEGRRIYFCCPPCIETFKKEPAKYLAKLEEAAGEVAAKVEEMQAEAAEKADEAQKGAGKELDEASKELLKKLDKP